MAAIGFLTYIAAQNYTEKKQTYLSQLSSNFGFSLSNVAAFMKTNTIIGATGELKPLSFEQKKY